MEEVSTRQEISYNKNRPLESIFQNTAARILDFLILNQKFDYSAPEMSKITQIPLRTIQRVPTTFSRKGSDKGNWQNRKHKNVYA